LLHDAGACTIPRHRGFSRKPLGDNLLSSNRNFCAVLKIREKQHPAYSAKAYTMRSMSALEKYAEGLHLAFMQRSAPSGQ
jgi:hypothetical protein